jgi:hypothetical protein
MLLAAAALCAGALLTARAQREAATVNNTKTGGDQPAAESETPGSQAAALAQAAERIREECIQGRRTICGKILKVLPDGLVVESGYTSLMRPPLNRSWLVPGTVPATREPNLVEGNETEGVCVGLVFLSDIPKSRSVKPKPFDYVVMQGYPAGQYSYTSAGSLQRTVRRFSAVLQNAVLVNCEAAGIKATGRADTTRAAADSP